LSDLRPDCPTPAALGRFMRVESPRLEARAVLRHLLTRCPQCLDVTRNLWLFGVGVSLAEVGGDGRGSRPNEDESSVSEKRT
jgi:hypothetical protein